jgi:hypothetical protein
MKRSNSVTSMAAILRTAARAADEFGVSCRELARRFAEQVDADHVSDADPLGLPIGLAFREVYQEGHAILATLYERRTAADPTIDRQAVTGIELAVTPSTCRYCPGLLLWTRDEAGKPLPLDHGRSPPLRSRQTNGGCPTATWQGTTDCHRCGVPGTRLRAMRIGGTAARVANPPTVRVSRL